MVAINTLMKKDYKDDIDNVNRYLMSKGDVFGQIHSISQILLQAFGLAPPSGNNLNNGWTQFTGLHSHIGMSAQPQTGMGTPFGGPAAGQFNGNPHNMAMNPSIQSPGIMSPTGPTGFDPNRPAGVMYPNNNMSQNTGPVAYNGPMNSNATPHPQPPNHASNFGPGYGTHQSNFHNAQQQGHYHQPATRSSSEF